MRSVTTKGEAVDRLRSGCEEFISCLKGLLRAHLEMDPTDRVICPDDEAIVYRMRKVLLHVKAITSWELDTEVMHVLAPELRTAGKQIELVWKKLPKEELSEYLGDKGRSVVGGRLTLFKSEKKILSSFIHPTPQRLLLGTELGGLGKPDEVRCFINLFTLLSSLVFRYGVSLCFLWQLQGGGKESSIAPLLMKATRALGSISPSDCLRFVSREN